MYSIGDPIYYTISICVMAAFTVEIQRCSCVTFFYLPLLLPWVESEKVNTVCPFNGLRSENR